MKNQKLMIRNETPADYHAVEALTREAFWKGFWGDEQSICEEHLLVRRLRESSAFVPELDFVAELDGRLAGHIIYSRSRIVDKAGDSHETLTFGPLSVLPEYQNRGIGRELMRYSFAEARRLGYRAVIIFGHPDYYPRAGFRRASEFGIITADGHSFDALLAYPLYDGALDGLQGRYYIDAVYEGLTQEDAYAFDKAFPPKERFIPAPITGLLDQLEPAARAAVQSLSFPSLTCMTTRSEREIRALPGIDDTAVAIIRAAMRDYGMGWGEGSATVHSQ